MSARAIVLFLLVIALSVPARADQAATLETAWELYHAGRFIESEAMSVAIGSSDALALAARTANVRALYLAPSDGRAALLQTARRHAEAALAHDPTHVDAALQLVIALGQSARMMKPAEAYIEGVADSAKEVLDRLEQQAGRNAYYHAVVGAWHAELVLRAGPIAARAFYGARWELAIKHYETARQLAPDAFAINTEYAKILLDRGRDTGKAVRLLRAVTLAVPSDAVEALIVEEAKTLLATAAVGLAPR